MDNKSGTILELRVNDVKRIKAVTIKPDGAPVVIIGGENTQGKSSVLDAITMAVSGEKYIPEEPIRRGAKRGSVYIDLGDAAITRTFVPSGGSLTIETKTPSGEKAAIRSPQAWLNERIGAISFDLMAFIHMDEKKRATTLRNLVGLDTTELEAERLSVYNERTDVNRALRDAEGAEKALPPFYPGVPSEVVSASALREQLAVERKKDEERRAIVVKLSECESLLHHRKRECQDTERVAADARIAAKARIEQIDIEIERLNKERRTLLAFVESKDTDARVEEAHRLLNEASAEYSRMQEVLESMPVGDVDGVMSAMAEMDTVNEKVRANQAKSAAIRKVAELQAMSDSLTRKIEEIDIQKADALKSAIFPVDGLSIDDEGRVTFHGIPLDQASQAEKIQVAMAVGLALNPTIRIVLIKDASLLDASSMKLIAEMAAAQNAQVWLERVGSGDPSAVIIEDGTVVERSPTEAVQTEQGMLI